jgi:serine/threonine protein kinase
MSNLNSESDKLKYEYTNLKTMISSLSLFDDQYKIEETLYVSHKKGNFVVADKNDNKYFMKAKLKCFTCDNDIEIYRRLKNNPHRNIHNIKHIYCTDKFLLIFSEYIEGFNMSYEKFKELCGRDISKIFKLSVNGLSHIHSLGIVHCDIKLSNIMIVPEIENKKVIYIPIIVDFDISKLVDDLYIQGNHGSYGYAAPEISKGEISLKSDIWELAMTFYYTLFENEIKNKKFTFGNKKCISPNFQIMDSYEGEHKNTVMLLKNMLNNNMNSRPNCSEIKLLI